MISASEMIGRVLEIVKGGSFEPPFVLSRINAAIRTISVDIKFSSLVVFGERIFVTAGSTSAAVPDDFSGSYIYKAETLNGDKIDIIANIVDLLAIKKNDRISAMCYSGGMFIFNEPPIENTTILVSYDSLPPVYKSVNDNGSAISFMPQTIGEDAVMYYAAYLLFSIIEGGMDGQKPNATTFYAMYQIELSKLLKLFGTSSDPRRPEQVGGLVW